MKQLNSYLSSWKTIYNQQGLLGKILLPGSFLLLICCFCSLMTRLLPASPSSSSHIPPSPFVYPSENPQATPTALFNFGFTPFPTLVAPSPLPTTPGPATDTQMPTQIAPTATETPLPTSTNLPPTVASSGSVRIVTVNKPEEYVDIQNTGNGPVDLSGWKLVSVTGNQACKLSGILQSNAVLRVWARAGTTGLSCGYSFNIWNDTQADPAVLYDSQGKEISRYPQ